MIVAMYLGAIVAAYLAGILLANSLRMKELGWKLGLILVTIAIAAIVCATRRPTFGVDLSGGTILVYEVNTKAMQRETSASTSDDPNATDSPDDTSSTAVDMNSAEGVDMASLVSALSRRINPSGVKEIVIRPYGLTQVEIIMPEASREETEQIKESIKKTGFLEFRILAHPSLHPAVWRLGEEARSKGLVDNEIRQDGKVVAEWVFLGREEEQDPETEGIDYKVPPDETMLVRTIEEDKPQVLVVVDPEENLRVEGRHLAAVAESTNQKDGSPSVTFRMTRAGARLFGLLTGSNLPDTQTGARHRLGIVLDKQLLSAPGIESQITTNGEITGNFTRKEVEQLVRILKAGRLPAVLIPEPISDNTVSPLLGEDTIRKGTLAVAASIVLVLVFMAVYYQFAGIVAGAAVLVNLLLTVGLMISIRAAFTLPGLAGLALTVGMAVDANVLIYERIREERARGATLRMAIRNGFARATTTIVDSNLTTVITAVALYIIAPDNIKGFAITLILGICISMFTAIFCTRVVFDIFEKKGWIKDLKMMRILTMTNFDFYRYRVPTTIASLVLIAVGLIAVVIRGSDILDNDFKVGTSVQFVLKSAMPIAEVRDKLAKDWTVTAVDMVGEDADTVYKVDSTLQEEKDLQAKIEELFRTGGGDSLLKTRVLKVEGLQALPEPNQTGNADETPRQDLGSVRRNLQGKSILDTLTAESNIAAAATNKWHRPNSTTAQLVAYYQAESSAETAQPETAQPEAAAPVSEPAAPPTTPEPTAEPTAPAQSATESAATPTESATSGDASKDATRIAVTYRSTATLTFQEPISAEVLKTEIAKTAKAVIGTEPLMELSNEKWDGISGMQFREWTAKFTSTAEDTGKVLGSLEQSIQSTPVWLSSSKTGAAVAANTKNQAFAAILVSLVGIIAYIWVRFQRVGYGFAAVLALVHDVLITLGAIAVSAWVASMLSFLMVEQFKINLSVIAAFLTIIGFSINDTIVIFDRIREVKGKNPQLTGDIINLSVNQTLSRTILTSGTVFIVVLILYFLGGAGIHALSFALIIGVIAGTYSSVFIAAPCLIWLANATASKSGSARRVAEKVQSK